MTATGFDVEAFRRLTRELPVFGPGSDEYATATSPDNAAVAQEPAVVVRPRSAADAAAAVAAAASVGATVVVQATGHGAGRTLGAETVVLDTSQLAQISIDADARTATVEAGAVWGDVQAAAEQHGLLGLSGSAPSVGVAGYTFGGGVGWLTRPYGLASAALQAVTYVDGTGHLRHAVADAPDPTDSEALWAFRGGAPPGLATDLTIGLFPVEDLWAGYLLWPAADADHVISAWASALDSVPDSVSSAIAILHLPPDGPFPPDLLDTPVVHLSYASPTGDEALRPLREAVRAVSTPVVDTTGPSDAARLSTIHLDPPGAEPSLGTGRWLSAGAADLAPSVLKAGHVGQDDGLQIVEIRHVAVSSATSNGAMTTLPGPFVVHAVGMNTPQRRDATERGLARVEAAAAPVALNAAVPFLDGHSSPGDAYDDATITRLTALADTVDPRCVFSFERTPVTRRT